MKKTLLMLCFTVFMLCLTLFCLISFAKADDSYFQLDYSTTTLVGDAVYTSPMFAVNNYRYVGVTMVANQDSATDGLKIIFYKGPTCLTDANPTQVYIANGTGWTWTAGSTALWYEASVRGDCAKVTYTNGSAEQGTFSMTVFAVK